MIRFNGYVIGEFHRSSSRVEWERAEGGWVLVELVLPFFLAAAAAALVSDFFLPGHSHIPL